MEKEEKVFGKAKLLKSTRQSFGYYLDLQTKDYGKTKVLISENLDKTKYCLIPNVRTDVPLNCHLEGKSLSDAVRKWIQKHNIENKEKI